MTAHGAVSTLAALVGLVAVLLHPEAAGAATSSLERSTEAVLAITSGADRIGTGFVIAPGYVITVAHVVDAAAGAPARILVRNSMVPYEVVAIDRQRDLALLSAAIPADVPAAVWGDSTTLVRGQDVIALGFPIGLQSVSLTKGVVSSPLQTFRGVEFVQTDAAINPGNSGGPLTDEQGRVVGVNVAKIAEIEVDAVGFAVPAADAIAFVERVAPDMELLTDFSAQMPTGTGGTTAGSDARPAVLWLAIGLSAALIVALLVRASRRKAEEAAGPGSTGATSEDDSTAEGASGPSSPTRHRAVFRVSSASRDEELDLRLPAVAGSAHNADIPVAASAANAYQVRFSPALDGVTALDLADEMGMYCGDQCVRTVVLRSGDSVRVGGTTIIFVRRYEA